ncbi:MAG: MBL fold metallo-hydrolase [Acidobacteria bacterium]|nr:MBL fold metallo-hydrolase [Acidobacteriota bacterium]
MFQKLILCCVSAPALFAWQSGSLDAAMQAMGAASLKTIQYSGRGAIFTLGQNKNPEAPWPRVEVDSFTYTLNYETPSSRSEAMQNKQRIQAFFSDGRAWNVVGNNTVPSPPAAATLRMMQIWLSPHGFLKAAAANKATVRSRTSGGRKIQQVAFTLQGKYRMQGTIGADNLVERVETRLDNPVLGDMPVEVAYSDYKDFGGVKFPTRIVQKDGGFPTVDFTVADARANVDLRVDVPTTVRDASPPAVKVDAQKIADGVWYLTGGSHHSLAVEFRDHVVAIEAPLSEERSLAVLAEIRKLIPNKPVKYVVSTHHHFDHSGGVRAVAAEGLTIVTHKANEAFYRNALAPPRTLSPSKKPGKVKPKILAFTEKHVMTDGARTLELHLIQGSPHHDGILMAYLPKEKILVEADVYTPAAPNAPPPAAPNPASVNLYENIQKRKLEVAQIAPIHGRLVPLSELERAIGKAR